MDSPTGQAPAEATRLVRGLGLIDATMIVVGSMIGSGIFIVSAKSMTIVGSPGWLLAAWAIAGVVTITGALCCAELAAMLPRAGGQYVFLREAYGPATGFLFGWTLFFVVQTGTIAAVAVAFAIFMGVLTPTISETVYLIPPIHRGSYAITLPPQQFLAMVGPLFAQSAWNNVTFTGSEIREPGRNLPRALLIGCGVVVLLYLLANLAYIVTLPLNAFPALRVPPNTLATETMKAALGQPGLILMAI